jgi:hypothetical protein
MNSALIYYSVVQKQADALRAAERSRLLPAADREPIAGRSVFARVARRTALRPAWSRL